ncbi:MAG: peptidoglycan editing factor PgeF [Phycisphaeraceae bacterium]|nr:peptidoglycan editing factor PgeF [Phycisphaeraceae bacterium]
MTGLRLSRQSLTGGLVPYQLPVWNDLGLPHAFTTRLGGVSAGPFASLNLGVEGCLPADASLPRDSPENILRNYTRLAESLDSSRRTLTRVSQVHGNRVLVAGKGKSGPVQEADAIITDDPRRLLAIRVADCVPILLACADGHIVGAIHAGWRGIVAQVVKATLDEIQRSFSVPADQFTCAIGPCISVNHFEVGPEVADEFDRSGLGDCVRRLTDQKPHIDLRAAAKQQLVTCGISAERIAVSDRCTYRDHDEFFSHRRDKGITGRMAAVIGCC